MPDDLYTRVLKEYQEMGGRNISFAPVVGEPLIDPNFIDRIKKAKSMGFKSIYACTNGILLYRYDAEELLMSGIDRLIISTPPFDRERFEKLCRSREYEKLLEGLEKLLLVNQKLGKPVRIEISFRSDIPLKDVLRTNDYQKYIKPYIDDERREISILVKGYDNWGGMIKQKDLLGEMELASIPRYKFRPCSRMFSCMIMWDGRVRACSCRFSNFDKEDELLIGDLNDRDLNAIWFGDKIRQLRRNFIENTLCVTCRNCAMYNPV
jgi:MoaA/NifB/PqqE/SkfB family radical SAM enzyme